MSGIESQVGWLWESTPATMYIVCVGPDQITWNSCLQSLVPTKSSFWVPLVQLIRSWSNVAWSLPPGVLVLGPLWEGHGCRSVSGAARALSSATCLELQSNPRFGFVVASAGHGCAWERTNCISELASMGTKFRDKSAYGPRHPEIYCQLPVRLSHWKSLVVGELHDSFSVTR